LPQLVGRFAIRAAPRLKPIESKDLLAAGMYDMTPELLQGYRVIGAVAFPALMVFLLSSGAGRVKPLTVMLAVLIALIIWYLPVSSIRRRGERRLDKIDQDIPELIDVLIATIEAGLGFGGSLQLLAHRFDGPLGEELRLTLQQQTLGVSTEVALRSMLERCDTPSVRSFVKTMAQGDSLGVSVGAMLRNLATETRQRRRAKTRMRAQKAPVKLLFPLVFLIFPAMLIVLGFPIVYTVAHLLGGS
jgi:tight adherence protein C